MLSRWKPFRPWLVLVVFASQVTFAQVGAGRDAVHGEEALLTPGPFAVGFRSTWAFDEGRTYRTAYDDGRTYGAEKAARPVLVLLWYPAEAAPGEPTFLPHGNYFSIGSEDPRLGAYAEALRAYAHDVLVQEVFGKAEAELDDEEHAELELLLETPTLCREGAEPAKGPFPLILHHSGAGSSFEDNAALCEFLASHGFVVLGSAFPAADGSKLGIDAGRGSAEDMQFLVRWAGALGYADWRHVGLVGHSAGAQAIVKYAAQPGCVADALVLLDTTQDYYSPLMPLHETLVREASAGITQLTRPMLIVAGPEAFFALCDTLVNAERTYLTVPELGHNEFISQGHQRGQRIAWHAATSASEADAGEIARTPAVRSNYRALCETVRSFLDAELGRGGEDFALRLEADRERGWSHDALCLVSVPRGLSGPEAYEPESPVPPTPRQFARLLMEEGAESACAVLDRFRDVQPRGPLYTSTMLAGSLLYELTEQGRSEEARLYYSALQQVSLPVLSVFEFLADIAVAQGKPDQAVHFLRVACGLEPSDAALAAKLQKLEGQRAR